MSAGCRRRWRPACAAAGSRAPPNFAPRVQTAHKMITGGIPFLLGELASQLVLSGEADAIRADVRARDRGARGDRPPEPLPASTSPRTIWRRSCG